MRSQDAAKVAVAVLVLLAVVVVLLIDRLDDDKLMAAMLGFLGVVFTAVVSFLGLLVKSTADKRLSDLAQQEQRLKEQTESRLELESAQERRTRNDAERRLKLEASMRAIPFLVSDGKPLDKHSVAGALFALTNLGYLDFVLPLVDDFLQEGNSLSPATAMWILGRALRESDDAAVHYQATTILDEHAVAFGDAGIKQLPDPLNVEWNAKYSKAARVKLLSFLVDAHISGPPPTKTSDLQTLTIPLHSVMEQDAELAVSAAQLLLPICERVCGHKKIHNHGAKELFLDKELEKRVRDVVEHGRKRAPVKLKAKADSYGEWLAKGGDLGLGTDRSSLAGRA